MIPPTASLSHPEPELSPPVSTQQKRPASSNKSDSEACISYKGIPHVLSFRRDLKKGDTEPKIKRLNLQNGLSLEAADHQLEATSRYADSRKWGLQGVLTLFELQKLLLLKVFEGKGLGLKIHGAYFFVSWPPFCFKGPGYPRCHRKIIVPPDPPLSRSFTFKQRIMNAEHLKSVRI